MIAALERSDRRRTGAFGRDCYTKGMTQSISFWIAAPALLVVSIGGAAGCECGPYPADAVGFKWERVSERELADKVTLSVASLPGGSRFTQIRDGLRCSIPLEVRRSVHMETEWRLTERRESFQHGMEAESTYAYREPASEGPPAASGEDGPSAEALAAKPFFEPWRDDESVTFASQPVQVEWRLLTGSNAVVASKSARIKDSFSRAEADFVLDREVLETIADLDWSEQLTVVLDITPASAGSSMSPIQRRFPGPTINDVLSVQGIKRLPKLRFDNAIFGKPELSKGKGKACDLVYRFSCTVTDRSSPAPGAVVDVSWSFEPESGAGASGTLRGVTAREFEIRIPEAEFNRLAGLHRAVPDAPSYRLKLRFFKDGREMGGVLVSPPLPRAEFPDCDKPQGAESTSGAEEPSGNAPAN